MKLGTMDGTRIVEKNAFQFFIDMRKFAEMNVEDFLDFLFDRDTRKRGVQPLEANLRGSPVSKRIDT